MLRFLFFILLVGCVACAAGIYVAESRLPGEVVREINPGALKIVSVVEGSKAQQEAMANKRVIDSLNGSACVDFSIRPADAARAQAAFSEMQLGSRLSVRSVDEFTRFGVGIAPLADKRAADTLLANLKKAGVKDISVLPDNGISLGVFSSEEAAKRYLVDLESKATALLKGAAITPRNPLSKETVFTVREPDVNLIARLTIMQHDFEASVLRAVTCAAAPSATIVSSPAVATSKGK